MAKNQAKKASAAQKSKGPPTQSSKRSSVASSKASSEASSKEGTPERKQPAQAQGQQPAQARGQQPAQAQGQQQPAAAQPQWVQQYQQQPMQQVPMGNIMGYQDPMAQMQAQAYVDPADPNTVHYEGFDAGARFTEVSPARVPPPPPGVMPNPAQVALMQGRNVVVTQRKSNLLSGGSSGGVDTSCTLQ